MVSMLDAALAYAERGWHVFPCAPGSKIPFPGSSGSKQATTDERQIRLWWEQTPTANVAIVTGSRSGLYVIDVDAAASEDLATLSPTLQARTPKGGWHYYYAHPAGEPLKNFVKPSRPGAVAVVGKDTDGRGEGGYVLAWPSKVDIDGEHKGYLWVNLDAIDIAPMPQWIVDKLRASGARPRPAAFSMPSAGYGNRALEDEARALASTHEGGRNDALNRATFRLAQLVAGGHLSQSSVEHAMLEAARACGLGEREAIATIASGLRSGMQHPRSPAPRHRREMHEPEVLEAEEDLPVDLGLIEAGSAAEQEDRERWLMLGRLRALGGLCDSFCGWVVRGADHPQPGLTVAACLALGAVLASRRFVFRGSTSSLFIASIARSGDGKNRPQQCVRRLLSEVWTHIGGPNNFSSSASLIDHLRDSVDIGVGTLLVIDEYGMQLQGFLGKRASPFRSDIKQVLTEVATNGTNTWRPSKSRAAGGGSEVIVAPSISLLGSTTPESLHGVLTEAEINDGFAGRHLWFCAQDILPMWQSPEDRGDDSIPSEVRHAIDHIRARHEEWHANLPQDGATADGLRITLRHEPVEITCSPGAGRMLTDFKLECDDRKRKNTLDGMPRSVLGRSPEYATRIAMSLALMAHPEADIPHVTDDIAAVAIELAHVSNEVLRRSIAANVVPTFDDPSRQADYVIEKIREAAGTGDTVSRTTLLRSARKMTSRQIDEIIARLHEEGRVLLAKQDSGSGRGGRPRILIQLVSR